MKVFITLASFIFLINCTGRSVQPAVLSPEDSQKTIEQLRSEVLSAACDETIRQEYETEIRTKESTLTENQLRLMLVQMKNNIRC